MIKHFLSLQDLSAPDLARILSLADMLKTNRGTKASPRPLEQKSVALIFEKASTRTRISFEVGVTELGGTPIVLAARDTQLGRGEPLADTARVLSAMVHAVVYRTHEHARLEALREHGSVPIVNGLSELYHPCQLLADLQTIREEFGDLEGRRVAWVGDGNNMAHSWILAAAATGMHLRIASPKGYEPNPSVLAIGERLGAKVLLTTEPREACDGAHVVNTDVWTSMGQESENAVRLQAFAGFCVNDALMSVTDKTAIFLHCLPAHRGEEVAASVLEGPQARVWRQAENRLHAQKALLCHILGEEVQ